MGLEGRGTWEDWVVRNLRLPVCGMLCFPLSEPETSLPHMFGNLSLCNRFLSSLKRVGRHYGVTYETRTGNLWGFFFFSYLLRATPPSWSRPSLTIDKVISKGTPFLICICRCLLKMWPLDGAILSGCSLSPALAAG